MNTAEIRELFLNYFSEHQHEIISSSSLLTQNDPTLLFTNAGMNQFKDCFLGNDDRGYTRATTAQKCLRVGGKHNDLENVGVTARHHTFFEMLGNFSFGDYFKEDAIKFAYNFINKIKLDQDRLWVTIFEDDDEAGELWQAVGVPADRILKCDEADNFWSMGETGPCGPCSELHYYIGDKPEAQSEAEFRKDDGTYLEFWNLVFMQFDRDSAGNLAPLPKPSIDTGMGLERMAAILNNLPANYETDVFRAIINTCEQLSGISYVGDSYQELSTVPEAKRRTATTDIAMRVIADHARAICFLVTEGVTPGSDGRNYVLRRIIRRAIRHGRSLEFKKNFLAQTCQTVIDQMSSAYPELKASEQLILKVADSEESNFNQTIDSGLDQLNKLTEGFGNGAVLSGKAAFLLHDTYGFPVDLTADALKSRNISVDLPEFDRELAAQKQRSRADRKEQRIAFDSVAIDAEPTIFVGYDQLTATDALCVYSRFDSANSCQLMVFDRTPFYAESGGQVADIGTISVNNSEYTISEVQKIQNKYYLHQVETAVALPVESGDRVDLAVDANIRAATAAHHTATHLVHAALQKFLGDHVKQAGSKVSAKGLRFDYEHFGAVEEQTLREISDWVNHQIKKHSIVGTEELDLEAAKESGAKALFGEKYGDKVRVVTVGADSKELCGGTHVGNTAEISELIILNDTGVSAGIRRIECIAGATALSRIQADKQTLATACKSLNTEPAGLVTKIEQLIETNRDLEQKVKLVEAQLLRNNNQDLLEGATVSPAGVRIVAASVPAADQAEIRKLIDELKQKIGSGVVAISSVDAKDKTSVLLGVTADLTGRINAGKILKSALDKYAGRGGGKPDFAQGGGVATTDLEKVLEEIRSNIE